jgi:hypothetical protein
MPTQWPTWRLFLEGKLDLADFDKVSIDDVDIACMALDAWRDAEERASKNQ